MDEKKKAWEKIEKDQIVTGIVRRLTDFGAFVDIGGVDGLIHVTDLSLASREASVRGRDPGSGSHREDASVWIKEKRAHPA